MTYYDSPNQQVVREDDSGPGRPPADFEVGYSADGLTVTLDVPEAQTALSYEVDWGDGTEPDYAGTGDEVAEHTYAEPGSYRVRVDPYGDENTEAFVDVTVPGEPAPDPPSEPEAETG